MFNITVFSSDSKKENHYYASLAAQLKQTAHISVLLSEQFWMLP